MIKSISSTISSIFLTSEAIFVESKIVESKIVELKTTTSIELKTIKLKIIDSTTNAFSTKKEQKNVVNIKNKKTRLKLRFRLRYKLIYFVVDDNYKRLCVSTFMKQNFF